ncbi:carbohydrate-binding domain-containing protein [Candidatus Saccharibacteria bacterium]|nr:carbohydrate-binding domain-containing protein [Candidatus Saccharibacteria bacterium]
MDDSINTNPAPNPAPDFTPEPVPTPESTPAPEPTPEPAHAPEPILARAPENPEPTTPTESTASVEPTTEPTPEPAVPTAPVTDLPPLASTEPKPKSHKKLFAIICASLVVIAGVVLAIVLNLPKNSDGETSSQTDLSKLIPNLATLDIDLEPSSFTQKVNLSDLSSLKTYTYAESYNDFLNDYKSGSLPAVYVTDFLFDGISVAKDGDTPIGGTVVNLNTAGNVRFTGTLKKGMLAVNTNGKSGTLNIYLKNATIDSDSKKSPAVYIYNSDINYADLGVTISPMKGTKNEIIGGKLSKVSLVAGDLYTADEIGEDYANVLFARVKADAENLADGDPAYYYKGAGAISSDIDLDFEGEGFLSVTSYNKEGIEVKSDLSFSRGIGDYSIVALDDCLNTTTAKDSSAYSSYSSLLYINVKSLYAAVSADGDEGDAIDSNGSLVIAGGTVLAFAHPTSADFGLDSATARDVSNNQYGTYITGGTVFATGSMFEGLSGTQPYVVFSNKADIDTGSVVITDSTNSFGFSTGLDRNFTTALFSSSAVRSGANYTLTIGDTVLTATGSKDFSVNTAQGGAPNGTAPSGEAPADAPEPPSGEAPNGETPPALPDGESPSTKQ